MPDTIISPSPVGKGITPEMPLEAPPEVKSMIFSFDPELMGKGGEIGRASCRDRVSSPV